MGYFRFCFDLVNNYTWINPEPTPLFAIKNVVFNSYHPFSGSELLSIGVRNSVVVEHLVQDLQDKSSMQEFQHSFQRLQDISTPKFNPELYILRLFNPKLWLNHSVLKSSGLKNLGVDNSGVEMSNIYSKVAMKSNPCHQKSQESRKIKGVRQFWNPNFKNSKLVRLLLYT